jgi:non-ribosomal peptide synthetase component E (peptide arylation enzyme)
MLPHAGKPLDQPVDMSSLLRNGLAERPNEPALASLQASWTWRELDRDADRLARNLLAMGLQPGDRVASLLPNCCITEVLYIACIRAGLVATPLNYRYMAPEIDHALKVSEASVPHQTQLRRPSSSLPPAAPGRPRESLIPPRPLAGSPPARSRAWHSRRRTPF